MSPCSGSQQLHTVHMCNLSDMLWQDYTLIWYVVQGLRSWCTYGGISACNSLTCM